MLRRCALLTMAAVAILFGGDRASGPIAAEMALPMLKATEPAEICLRPGFEYGGGSAGQETGERTGALAVPADWPGRDVPGGDACGAVPPPAVGERRPGVVLRDPGVGEEEEATWRSLQEGATKGVAASPPQGESVIPSY